MADPVSWLMIRPGWKVVAADGSEVGSVDEVTGDSSKDIFDGLAVATSALGKPLYVPAEQVGEIVEGTVRLTVTPEQVAGEPEYLEPASSEEIEADSKSGMRESLAGELRKVEGETVAPVRRERPMSIGRRLYFVVRRLFR
jgi:hypothetical protein